MPLILGGEPSDSWVSQRVPSDSLENHRETIPSLLVRENSDHSLLQLGHFQFE